MERGGRRVDSKGDERGGGGAAQTLGDRVKECLSQCGPANVMLLRAASEWDDLFRRGRR